FRLGLHFGRDPLGVVFDGADGVLGGDENGEYKRDRGQQSVHGILRIRVLLHCMGYTPRKARRSRRSARGVGFRPPRSLPSPTHQILEAPRHESRPSDRPNPPTTNQPASVSSVSSDRRAQVYRISGPVLARIRRTPSRTPWYDPLDPLRSHFR